MAVVSLVIAVCALLFTVGSFWWIQARRSKLSCFPVQAFSGYLHADRARLRLPLSIFNSGPVPRVVTDLQLLARAEGGDEIVLHLVTFRRSLKPQSDDTDDFAHPFAVPGRSVVSRHSDFAYFGPPAALTTGEPVTVRVQALVDHQTSWVDIGRMVLHVEIMAEPNVYITYSNHPHIWPDGQKEKAAAAFATLRQQMGPRED